MTTKEESLHKLQQKQEDFELHRRIKELEGDVARLAKENNLPKGEVKAKTNQFGEAQTLVEGMCCEIEKLKSQLQESKSQYENQNREMAEMRKGISKPVREVAILRRLLEASDPGSLSVLERLFLEGLAAGKPRVRNQQQHSSGFQINERDA